MLFSVKDRRTLKCDHTLFSASTHLSSNHDAMTCPSSSNLTHNCAVCVISLCYTHTQHRAHVGDRPAILRSCSNLNNDEKFRAQSLQQLQ